MASGRRLTIALAVIAAMPLLYVGFYFALVRHSPYYQSEGGMIELSPDYALLPGGACRFFEPIYQVDSQWLRPGYWRQAMFPANP
jgi:hypothetical protein